MTEETTSPNIASIAARGLTDPTKLTLDEIQQVCASALTQAEDQPETPSDPEAE